MFRKKPIYKRGVPYAIKTSDPSTSDIFDVPMIWVNIDNDTIWILRDVTSGVADWKEIGSEFLHTPYEVVYNSTDVIINLTIVDMNKILVVDNANPVTVNLPSVGVDEIGDWIEVQKLGAGTVTIVAADNDVIMDSIAGGNIANAEAAETWAFVGLCLLRTTIWGCRGMLGSWSTS